MLAELYNKFVSNKCSGSKLEHYTNFIFAQLLENVPEFRKEILSEIGLSCSNKCIIKREESEKENRYDITIEGEQNDGKKFFCIIELKAHWVNEQEHLKQLKKYAEKLSKKQDAYEKKLVLISKINYNFSNKAQELKDVNFKQITWNKIVRLFKKADNFLIKDFMFFLNEQKMASDLSISKEKLQNLGNVIELTNWIIGLLNEVFQAIKASETPIYTNNIQDIKFHHLHVTGQGLFYHTTLDKGYLSFGILTLEENYFHVRLCLYENIKVSINGANTVNDGQCINYDFNKNINDSQFYDDSGIPDSSKIIEWYEAKLKTITEATKEINLKAESHKTAKWFS